MFKQIILSVTMAITLASNASGQTSNPSLEAKEKLIPVQGFDIVITPVAQPYDNSLEPKPAFIQLFKTDCRTNFENCRYFATLEYVARFKAMKIMMEKEMGRKITDAEWKRFQDLLDKWHVWKDPKLKQALLETPNPLLEFITKDMVDFFQKRSPSELASEYEHLGLIADQGNPEMESQVLKKSINYAEWLNSLNDAREKTIIIPARTDK